MEISVCDNASKPMAGVLIQGLNDFSEALIASAFITEAGAHLLMEGLKYFAQVPRHKLTVVTGNYQDFTTAGALEQLRDLEQSVNKQSGSKRVAIRFVCGPTTEPFHPKVYLFMGKWKALLVVGSGNLTEDGLKSNTEAYVQVSGTSQTPLFQEAKRLILMWADSGTAVTNEVLTGQRDVEHQREVGERLRSLLTPFLSATHVASSNDYIKMCDFVCDSSGCNPLTATAKTLLQCAREGRIVELHVSHGGLWLTLPGGWFNADRQLTKNHRIYTATQVGYYIFGKAEADKLQELENAIRSGSQNYGWRTRRGLFVPDNRWDEYRKWFEAARLHYADIADSVVGPVRGRIGRAEKGLRQEIDSTWNRYNPRRPLKPGLVGQVTEILRRRLDDT